LKSSGSYLSNRMRVLKTVQFYYPFQDRGGPVFKVRALARSLAHRGHHISVLTADLGIKRFSDGNLQYQHCAWGWRGEEDGVEAIYLPTFGHYRSLTLNPRVLQFCGASLDQYDLVHFYGLYDLLGPIVSHYCRSHDVPYVIEPMGMYRPIDRSFRLKRWWHGSLGKAHVSRAAQIVATSEMEQQDLIEEGVPREKIVIRYNGVDAPPASSAAQRGSFRAKWAIPLAEPLVLFLSRLIPRKGADMLIEAFAQACPQRGTLVVGGPEGEAGYVAHLKKCAEQNGVGNRVVFTGPIYDADKAAMFADTDVFVLASRYENFANVVAEAVACDIPVIVSNMCGIHSLIDGRAGLVIPVERDALAQALKALLGDALLYERFKAGCRPVAQELTWGTLSGQMENYYSQILATSGRVQ
jgi:glycosyltransferase involved in cell wall biosynthesis